VPFRIPDLNLDNQRRSKIATSIQQAGAAGRPARARRRVLPYA
jgi:hypothetical protein